MRILRSWSCRTVIALDDLPRVAFRSHYILIGRQAELSSIPILRHSALHRKRLDRAGLFTVSQEVKRRDKLHLCKVSFDSLPRTLAALRRLCKRVQYDCIWSNVNSVVVRRKDGMVFGHDHSECDASTMYNLRVPYLTMSPVSNPVRQRSNPFYDVRSRVMAGPGFWSQFVQRKSWPRSNPNPLAPLEPIGAADYQ